MKFLQDQEEEHNLIQNKINHFIEVHGKKKGCLS